MLFLGKRPAAVVGAIALGMLTSACAGNNLARDVSIMARDTSSLSPAQQQLARLEERSAQIRAGGALLGAGLGAGIGIHACKNEHGARKVLCIAAATVTGGTGGYVAGAYVAARTERAAATRENLEGSLADSQEAIAYYDERIAGSNAVLLEHRTRIAELNQLYRTSAVTEAAYLNEYEQMQLDRATVASFVQQAQGDLRNMEEELKLRRDGGQNVTALAQQRDALRQRNVELRSQLSEMDAVLSGAPSSVRAAAT